MKTKMIAAVAGLLVWGSQGCMEPGPVDVNASNPVPISTSSEDVPGPVLEAMKGTEKTAPAREADRAKVYEAQSAQLEPTGKALYESAKAKGVDMSGFLAASKQYVETPLEQLDPKLVDSVNGQYGPAIRSAIASAVAVPGVGGLLQEVQGLPSTPPPPPPGIPGGGNGCCTSQQFQPPWSGLYTEGDFGARAIAPGSFTTLSPGVRSAIASAPHRLQQSGHLITVSSSDSRETVSATLGTNWVIGLSGLGYAHVWLGLDMWVTKPDGTVVCRAPHVEQDNQWTWAGGFLTLSDHRPGPTVIRTCSFDRVPGDPTEYSVNVSASVDGTFIGFSGGYGDYFVNLGVIDVISCQ